LKPSQYISLINSIEEKFPVAEWVIDGIHIWPIVRINENKLPKHEVQSKSLSRSYSTKISKRVSYFSNQIYSHRYYLLYYLKDLKNNQKLTKLCDAIFVTSTRQRGFYLNNGWYDISCDPFIDFFDKNNLKCCVLEFTSHAKYKIPRFRKSKFIQPSFDLIPILSKLNSRQKCSYRLDGYQALQQLLERKGLSNYLPDINYLMKQIRLVNSYKEFYIRIFSKVKPKIGFCVCYYGKKGMAFNLACREFGIPSVDIQHGVAGELHRAYGKWNSIPQNGFELLPTFFWCWSEVEAKSINKWRIKESRFHIPIVGGALGIQKWLSENTAFSKYKGKAQEIIRPDKINLLVTHQGIKLPKWFIEIIKSAPSNYKWFIRLHPKPKRSMRNIDDIMKAEKNENVDIKNATELPLMALLERINIHITLWSSIVLEAKQFGVPSIVIHENGKDLFKNEIENGDVKIALSRTQFMAHVRELMKNAHENSPIPFQNHSEKALQHLLKIISLKEPTGAHTLSPQICNKT